MNTTNFLDEYVTQILTDLNDFEKLMNENSEKMEKSEFFDWYLDKSNPINKYILFPKYDNFNAFGEDKFMAYEKISDKCQEIIKLFHRLLSK